MSSSDFDVAVFDSPSASTEQFIRSQTVVSRVVAGETLIVPIRSRVGDLASIYSFNGTGSLIWSLLSRPRTVKELASAVAGEYDIHEDDAERDVRNFVNEMKVVGLVEASESIGISGAE